MQLCYWNTFSLINVDDNDMREKTIELIVGNLHSLQREDEVNKLKLTFVNLSDKELLDVLIDTSMEVYMSDAGFHVPVVFKDGDVIAGHVPDSFDITTISEKS